MDEFISNNNSEVFAADFQSLTGFVLDSAQDEILWADANGKLIYANRSACSALEYSREELLSMTVSDICPDFPPHIWTEHWQELKTAGHMVLEIRQRSRSGSYTLMEISTNYVQHGGRELSCAFGRNIADRKRVERELTAAKQQLMESEERYRTIIENKQDIYYRTDAEGRLTMMSPSGPAILGYDSVNEVIGLNIRETFYCDPEERDAFLHNLLLKGEVYNYEITLKHRNGTPLPAATSSHLLFTPDGTLMGVEGVYRDTSQFRQAMDKLKASEDKFARAFTHAPVLMTISGISDGRYLEVNDRFCEISGFSRQEVLGRTSLEIGWLSPAERQRIIAVFKRDGRVGNMEITLTAKEGAPVYCLYSAELISAGGEDQLLSIALDITGRKHGLEALAYANQCFTQALNGSRHILYRLNVKKGCYDYLSPVFEELSGYPVADFMKNSFEQLLEHFHPDDRQRILGYIDEAFRTRTGPTVNLTMEYRFRKADGNYGWVQDVNTACFNEQGELECFFGSALDIGERLLLQQEQEKNQRLESLGVLAGGIAHDFNNILTAILGNISMARRLVGDEHQIAPRLIDSEKAAIRASELTQQLLTFARGGEPVRRVVNTLKLIDEAVGFALQGSNVKGIIEADSGLYAVNADGGQLSQVFNNLLINAKQAMHAGGIVTVTAKNLMVLSGDKLPLASGTYVQIDIADQGDGIPPEQLGKIFDPYFTTKANGSGLGLSTVYSIIKRHGGHISVTSEHEQGTVFSLFLTAIEEAHGSPETNRTPQVQLSGSGRILIMDDEQIIRDLARIIFEEAGYQVVDCGHGAMAFEEYRLAREQGARFDAVILDLTVPGGMGGREAAALIRKLDPSAVLIVSSGYSNAPVMADYISYGFNGSAVKPYTFDALLTVLSHAMEHARSI